MSVLHLLLLPSRHKIHVSDLNTPKMRLYNGRVLLSFLICLIYLTVTTSVNNIINAEAPLGMSHMARLSKENQPCQYSSRN